MTSCGASTAATVRSLSGFTREEIASHLGLKGGGTFSKILDSQAGAQIDLVIERDDHVVNLCEIKFLSVPYEPDNADEMRYRLAISMLQKHLSPKQYIHMTLVSTYGLKAGMHSGIFQQVVTMEQLFFDRD